MFLVTNKSIKLSLSLLVFVLLSACQLSSTKPDQEKIAKAGLSTQVKQKYAYALQLMGAGDEAAAMKMLNDVSQLNDSLSGPYANRGLLYLKRDDKAKAEKQFRDAIKRNAKNVTALNQLGVLLREKKDFKAARKNYEAALQIDKSHANAHLNLGVLCDIYLQDKPCAVEHFEAYQKINGEDKMVTNWLIDLKEQL